VKRGVVVALSLFVVAVVHAAEPPELPKLPPLTEPATDRYISGKFIWADYFTSNVEAARIFYAALFGWDWKQISGERESRYGMFYQNGEPVAGIAYHAAPDVAREYGRWIYYVSVPDVAATVNEVAQRGGRTLLAPRSFADRGTFAVVADPEGALFGVMHATGGDPLDYRADVGDWLWLALYARNAAAASQFYRGVFDYEVREPTAGNGLIDYLLVRHGYARAAIAQLGTASEAHPSWLGYVRVNDVANSAATALRLGATQLLAPNPDRLNGDLTILADPLGAPLGLVRWTYPEDAAEGSQ
jgi:predicted enzyme related to lactoylglutathione lyase